MTGGLLRVHLPHRLASARNVRWPTLPYEKQPTDSQNDRLGVRERSPSWCVSASRDNEARVGRQHGARSL
jgi:hypothetical protein